MDYLVRDQELLIEYHPNKGAITYRVVVPNTRHLRGVWHQMEVAGTIDDYELTSGHLRPLKGRDAVLCVNAAVRKQLGKQAGDAVRVTLYRVTRPVTGVQAAEVLSCFEDAGVLSRFQARSAAEQAAILDAILQQPDEAQQEKQLLDQLAALAS